MSPLHRITPEELHGRRWELLALTSIGAFISPLDTAIVAVALPVMGPALHLSFATSMWVQAAYLLAMAVLLIPMGRLADQHGRVRFYLLGIAVFTVGSLLAALSMNATWMIGSRVVQGAGAALLSATSAAIVTAVFPARERGRALGINVMAIYLGLSIGPPLGGFLAGAFGWRWIFLVNLPIGAISLLWGWLLLPRAAPAEGRAPRPDVLGSVLLATFLICLLVPLTFAAEWGWTAPGSVAMLSASALALAVFVLAEQRVAAPLFDLDLLRHNRLFAAANLAALLNYMALASIGILTAIFLELTQGRSPGVAGWLLLSQPALMALLSPWSGRLSDRVGSRALTTAGMLVIALGMAVLATMGREAGVVHVASGLAVVGLGMAAFSAPNSSAVMGSVRHDQLSLASAFLATMRVIGMALSIAVLGGVAASQLGRTGGRLLFAPGTSGVASQAAAGYALGYRYAMLVGVALALCGALVSLTRGRHSQA